VIPAVMPTYGRTNIAFQSGEGAWLQGADGRRYLDFGSGIAVCSLGHCHPRLVKALQDQAAQLWHVSNLYESPGQTALAEKLVQNSFADTVFFSNSGAEALEGALKIARRYQQMAVSQPDRYRVITVSQAFHGRTLATLAAGDSEKNCMGFAPLVEGFDTVPFGNLNALRAAITAETAAILVEPIQGEGGIRVADHDYLRGLRAAADEFGLLLIFDEVQTGMGRTGHLFAYEAAGIAPDIMALAKGLGSGFPVGAILASEKAASAMAPGSHGSTFGGNPLAMAVANTVLDIMLQDGFLAHVQEVSARLEAGLQKLVETYPAIFTEVRGVGLMRGLKCGPTHSDLIAKATENGLLTVPAADNVIRLLPPLVISAEEVDTAIAILLKTAADWAATSGQDTDADASVSHT